MSLQIYSMHIETTISNRFAKTLITSNVKNTDNKAKETTFSVILPENAFISEFEMEIDGKIFKAYVKEKEDAKAIYSEAVSSGLSAAHVELNARDSKKFTVSVNIEPSSETIFRLTYEELLQRQNGQYELIINVHPGQIVDDLCVEVKIDETRPLTFVKTPSLRTGNEISDDKPELDPCATTEMINANSAKVKFNPDKEQQKKYAELLGSKDQGLAGQFVVQYDVERDPKGGEVLLRDGYFVHFFAPSGLQTFPKHVVFVLDHSASMKGRKYEQLMQAMDKILSDLNPDDLFHIVRFSENVSVWNLEKNKFDRIRFEQMPDYENLDTSLAELNLGEAIQVTEDNIEKAKKSKRHVVGMGCTNIIGGLVVGLFLVRRTLEKNYEKNVALKHQPMIIFLTDGLPNVGISNPDEITKLVTKINQGTNRAAIFSLSFGEDADKNFLKKLSAQNLGFSRHIYEAADAALQLQNFYRTVSSPLLRDVRFKYVDKVSEVTRIDFPIFFLGSEFVIAGRCGDTQPLRHVEAFCTNGCIEFETDETESDVSLERLWAYLTVKQLLDEAETSENGTELTKKALDLALKYSFVTSVTSLVVVKPQENDLYDYENTQNEALELADGRSRVLVCSSRAADLMLGRGVSSQHRALKFSGKTSPLHRLYSHCKSHVFVAPELSNLNVSSGIRKVFTGFKHKDEITQFKTWVNTTQPHLPQINGTQASLFLHCCDYNEDLAKDLVDSYFTIRTLCPEFFTERSTVLNGRGLVFIGFIAEKTQGYICLKLLEVHPNRFDLIALVKYFDLVCSLYFNKGEMLDDYCIVFDLTCFTLKHLNKMEASVLKTLLFYLQEAFPLKIKGIHCYIPPSVDSEDDIVFNIMALIKPLVKEEIISKIYFHNSVGDLFNCVPKKCLFKAYGGTLDVINLECKTRKELFKNLDFLEEEEEQVVDETKRVGPPKITKDCFN
ncbi:inter-alpha-trypsin inhibitor heavy chain H4 isoform X1 [Tribolium castaneum]|uniref:inter-alpha-trypsin inhibitor heavy chain H4 isoform X1 n=1 Tax=Tribolium castaneum TaxID=7070 RepID=UPI00077DE1C2|nr:PREDICTED: inter-alpha-trypsin inhibitor heavy chain H4 isoform X1 [Tribolium castaneum]XP_015836286.1 PREDICTED: inter-alpha-trypsin inhibitor heavy chain H4 isoform X1 [Tribolium castaneum]|eukprot:XP_015836285.1 PREDICTED: inter-alpha-trypsin inhibitor heavy chain H4 isoform X1 [Tribolium castaneum]